MMGPQSDGHHDRISSNYEIAINTSPEGNISPLSSPSLPSSPLSQPPPINISSTKNSTSFCCCPLCSEKFKNHGVFEPKVLNCGHTLCFHCLEGIYLSNGMKRCPFCKSDLRYDHPALFPKNFYLVEILEDGFLASEAEEDYLPQVNYSHRLKLARLHCEYERSLLDQSRNEIIEYDRLRSLAEAHIREIDRHSQVAIQTFHETQKRLDKSLSILSMLYSLQEARYSQHFEFILSPDISSPNSASSPRTSLTVTDQPSFISPENLNHTSNAHGTECPHLSPTPPPLS